MYSLYIAHDGGIHLKEHPVCVAYEEIAEVLGGTPQRLWYVKGYCGWVLEDVAGADLEPNLVASLLFETPITGGVVITSDQEMPNQEGMFTLEGEEVDQLLDVLYSWSSD